MWQQPHFLILVLVLYSNAADDLLPSQVWILNCDPTNTSEIVIKLLSMEVNGHWPDIWSSTAIEGRITVMFHLSMLKDARKFIDINQCTYRVSVPDVQMLIDEEIKERKKRSGGRRSRKKDPKERFHHRYNDYADMKLWMDLMARENPTFVSCFNLTQSWENETVYGLKIGTEGKDKENIFLDAGVHAREWISPAAVLYAASQIISSHQTLSELLNKYNIYIIPVLNPDGYKYSREAARLWRKTRSRHDISKGCFGVDANRNWDFRWGDVASDSADLVKPCENIYAGPSAFSEREVRGMKEYIEKNLKTPKLYITLHSYGQYILGPWGYTTKLPDNHLNQRKLALIATAAIRNQTRAVYSYGTIAKTMYKASGTSVDFWHNYGVPYAYAMELPPLDEYLGGFFLPAVKIRPSGLHIYHGLIAMLKALADPVSEL